MKAISAAAALLVAASMAQGAERVLVLPFSVLNVPESQQWIGKGVQENIVAEFGRSGEFAPVAFQGQVIVEDNATAARLARTAQSPYAVRGAAQAVGDQVRLTAQLIDAKSGDTLRTASVTGQSDNLLKMEDELAAQLRGYAQPAATPNAAPAAPASPAPVVVQQPSAPAYSYGYPAYPYYADYGYSYGYPYYYYPGFYSFSFVTGNVDRNHDHDHGHWGGGDNGGGRGDGNWGGGGNGGGLGGRGGNGGGGGNGRGGGGGVPQLVNNFNPTALPIPNNNVLPIPTNNVLPVPANRAAPAPAAGGFSRGGGAGGGSIPSARSGGAPPVGSRAVISPRSSSK
jgi:TolB-like protein